MPVRRKHDSDCATWYVLGRHREGRGVDAFSHVKVVSKLPSGDWRSRSTKSRVEHEYPRKNPFTGTFDDIYTHWIQPETFGATVTHDREEALASLTGMFETGQIETYLLPDGDANRAADRVLQHLERGCAPGPQ